MIYTADWIVTQDDARSVVENGALRVEGSFVAEVGPAAEVLARHPGEPVSALGEAAILPGLIDAHTHVPMSAMRGTSDDKELFAWLTEDIFPREARWEPRLLRAAARLSFAEMVRTGCSAFYDMYMLQENVFAAADEAGVRGVIGENVTRFFPQLGGATRDALFGRVRDNAAAWRGHPRLRGSVAPHAVYTTDPGLLRACRDLADEVGWQFGMHMSETRKESADCLSERGARPIPYCDSLGILRDDTSLFHCVDVDDADLAILRARGCAAVHNPASNMKLASGAAPVPRLLAAGVPVALGTDGPASNNAQNMLRETWLAALLGKLAAGDPTAVSAQTALDLATRGGAAAIHDPLAGSLEPGKHADFFALDLRGPGMQPVHNVVSSVVYAATGLENRLTVVDGRELYRDGEWLSLDIGEVLAGARELRDWARR
ncbi:MAG: amidohydrolase [Kiritimatiellae bacterium]|nr:amidohydrolase [Kiritimatiellia bacterium]